MREETAGRASINLELALLIGLLVLTCVVGLSWTGNGIGNIYNSAAGVFGIAGAGGPSVPDLSPIEDPPGSGLYPIGPITGGTAPYRIVKIDDPSGTNRVDVPGSETGPGPIYTVQPLEPGDNYYQVVDSDGRQLPVVITITLPLPPLPLVCPALVQTDGTNGSIMIEVGEPSHSVPVLPSRPLVVHDYATYMAAHAAPAAGWPATQVDPATSEVLMFDELCLRCHEAD